MGQAQYPMIISSRPTASDEPALREPGTQDVAADSKQMSGLHLVFVAIAIGLGYHGGIDALVEFRPAVLKHLYQDALKCQESGLACTGSL